MNPQEQLPGVPLPTSQEDRITHEPGKSYAIVAKLELIRIAPSGERTPISFAVAAPYLTLDGFWRTPVRISGFGDPSPEIYGIDSLQSLYLAMEIIRKDLAALVERGEKLSGREGRDFSMDEYFRHL